MERRAFLTTSLAAGSATLAAPAVAQSLPTLKWRMTSSFPRNLDITFGAADLFCKNVAAMTDGKFQIQQFAAGEIVGGFQALDAVQSGTVEMAATGALFYIGKDPTFALAAAVPFMMNARQQHAWLYHAGGNEMLNEFFHRFNVHGLPCGQTGNQWGGWFRKDINTAEDLKGLKMRVAGIAGFVMAKVGVIPQQIPPGDIYPALERGVIDAVEFIGPYDDEKLGLAKVAKNYYYPGWGEGGTIFHALVNLDRWNELPQTYKTVIEGAAQAATLSMMAHYDAKNPDALYRLVAAGTQLKSFSNEIIDTLYAASQELYKEISAKNDAFKTILESQTVFRDRSYSYHQFADYSFDALMLRLRRKG